MKINPKKINEILDNKGKDLLGEAFEGMNAVVSMPAINKMYGRTEKMNETVPMGAMDKIKFMKYFDLVLKTAGADKAKIYKVLKKMMPSLDNRVLLYMAQGFEDAVTQMTGEQ
tara:strand:+ start:1163 stop:1501 length:339 start_codon:yes stop_codon:yes gene_type:complete